MVPAIGWYFFLVLPENKDIFKIIRVNNRRAKTETVPVVVNDEESIIKFMIFSEEYCELKMMITTNEYIILKLLIHTSKIY